MAQLKHTGFSVNGRRVADLIVNGGTPAERVVGSMTRKRNPTGPGYRYRARVAGVVVYEGISICSALERAEAHLERSL